MIHAKNLDFSFSGLKTHILYYIRDLSRDLNTDDRIQIGTEFEEAAKDVLVFKSKHAIEEHNAQTFVVGGGVASNSYLKESFENLASELGVTLNISSKELSTDNALMIALTCANQIELEVPPTKEFIAIGSKNYKWK